MGGIKYSNIYKIKCIVYLAQIGNMRTPSLAVFSVAEMISFIEVGVRVRIVV